MRTGECLQILHGHTDIVTNVTFSPDGHCALSGSNDKTIRLWDIATGQCLRTFHGGHGAAAYSPDGCFIISGSDGNTFRLWNVATGKCLRTIHGHTGTVYSIAFSHNGRFALSGSHDRTLRLWEFDWEYEYDPDLDPVLKRRAEKARNESLRGRIMNLFTGKNRKK